MCVRTVDFGRTTETERTISASACMLALNFGQVDEFKVRRCFWSIESGLIVSLFPKKKIETILDHFE